MRPSLGPSIGISFKAGLALALAIVGLASWTLTRPQAAAQDLESDSVESLTESDLVRALSALEKIPAGRALVTRAQKFWGYSTPLEVARSLRWGQESKTDAVLTRHYNPRTGKEKRERQVLVYLRSTQPMSDVVLDMAHELVHATARSSWDPYDPKLTAGKYIWAAIEGEGGEVDAVVSECRVAQELKSPSFSRCEGYLTNQQIDRQKVKADFYRAGKWGGELRKKLGHENELFPLLSEESPKLYSSTGHAPYPAALMREFEEINAVACQNSRKRSLASVSDEARKDTTEFLAHRCSSRN